MKKFLRRVCLVCFYLDAVLAGFYLMAGELWWAAFSFLMALLCYGGSRE